MQLIPVTNKVRAREFLTMPLKIYEDDPNYIRPLDKDILAVFDPKKNKAFRNGDVTRWLLYNDAEEPIGRIAAFVQKKYRNMGDEQKTGGIGFFECIHNQDAADMLFDVAKNWLMQQGMEAMDGPINFGERDRWWGLVVQGFQPPIYLMNYNPPYYQELFENYGFKKFYDQMCFAMPITTALDERFKEKSKIYEALPDYEAKHIRKNEIKKFARDFCIVYNKAWAGHQGNKEMSVAVAEKMFGSMKPIIDERIVWFVYYKNEPIAFWINLPELNEIFKDFNGKFGLWQKIQFLFRKRFGSLEKITGIVFGVAPEFQGKGIDYFMIMQGAKTIQHKLRYEQYEMQWQGDFNPRIVNISKHLGAQLSRRLTTFRYLFDRTKEFKRHPILK